MKHLKLYETFKESEDIDLSKNIEINTPEYSYALNKIKERLDDDGGRIPHYELKDLASDFVILLINWDLSCGALNDILDFKDEEWDHDELFTHIIINGMSEIVYREYKQYQEAWDDVYWDDFVNELFSIRRYLMDNDTTYSELIRNGDLYLNHEGKKHRFNGPDDMRRFCKFYLRDESLEWSPDDEYEED